MEDGGRIEVMLARHSGVEAGTTCRTWQRPVLVESPGSACCLFRRGAGEHTDFQCPQSNQTGAAGL